MQFVILRDNKSRSYCLFCVSDGVIIGGYRTLSVLFSAVYAHADGVPFNIRYKII